MDLMAVKQSLSEPAPPPATSIYVQALWYDKKENWEKAHELIQDLADNKAAWIHAYLHRKEGDLFNADYWYRRAGQKRPHLSLDAEWEQLLKAML